MRDWRHRIYWYLRTKALSFALPDPWAWRHSEWVLRPPKCSAKEWIAADYVLRKHGCYKQQNEEAARGGEQQNSAEGK